MKNLLLNEINELQKEYKAILINSVKKISVSNSVAILDEINTFWYKNQKLVRCALEYLSKPYYSFIFTAATILDINDNEHYPFLCLGDYHIWDDPIYGYLNMSKEASNNKFSNKMKDIITNTINANIEISDTLDNKILIFPLRMISGIDKEFIRQKAEKIFCNLFKNPPKSIKEFLDKYKTIQNIDSALREDVKSILSFTNNDMSYKNWIDRFNHYKFTTTIPINTQSDSTIFFFAIFGYFSQALDVILTCSAYQLVPYVRYDVAFRYILNISNKFKDNQDVRSWLFKFIISHILHSAFDKDKYCKIEIKEFVQKIKQNKFENKLFQKLKEENICVENPDISKIIEIINNQLSTCFSDL